MPRFLAAALAIALAFSLPAPSFAAGGTNGTINGTVIDALSGQPIAGVTVNATSPSSSASGKTDGRGTFALLGLPVDTYTIGFTFAGYELAIISGVTVEGDQQQTLSVRLQKRLTTIGRISARAPSGAFQPSQTTDTYSITGKALTAASGKQNNTEERALIASVPGLTINASYFPVVRGSLRTEVGYQLDGVDYTDAYTNQFAYSLRQSGLASLQVSPGAGDPSQGNTGAGSVNFVIKRGARPAFGSLDLEALAYPFNHQISAEYGWATPDGRFSNFTSFYGRRNDYQYGSIGSDATHITRFFATASDQLNDFLSNSVYRFGKESNQSLQFLYAPRVALFYIGYGGVGTDNFYKTNDPYALTQAIPSIGFNSNKIEPGIAQFQQIVPLLPGQASVTSKLPFQPNQVQPSDLYKLEYTNTLNATTFASLRISRLNSVGLFNTFYTSAGQGSAVTPQQGSWRDSVQFDLTKQANSKNNVQLSVKYDVAKPFFDAQSNILALRAIAPIAIGAPGGYEIADFLPNDANCPTLGGKCGYLLSQPRFAGQPFVQVPIYANSTTLLQQEFAIGLRDVISFSDRFKVDLGVRSENANILGFTAGPTSNSQVHPRLVEPRTAATYRITNKDAVRFSFGRSSELPSLTQMQTLVNPVFFQQFAGIPSYDNRTGKPSTVCGTAGDSTTGKLPCADYAQQLHDEYTNFANGPENTPVKPNTYSNFDASYSRVLGKGYSVRVTPFFRRGYDIVSRVSSQIGTDPLTGSPVFGPSVSTNNGINKTSGAEFYLTKDNPDQFGFSGFLSATYLNELTNVPPSFGNQDIFVAIPTASLRLGDLYRASYNSPLNVQAGVNYRSSSGFRVNPVVNYTRGYPIGAGNTVAAFVNGLPYNIPSSNASVVGGGVAVTSGSASTAVNYVDPQNPGSVFNPKYAATRGTPEAASPGGILSRPRYTADLYFEYNKPGARSTFGVGITNLFGNIYSQPVLNDRYQPVATGIAGPLTGLDTRPISAPGIGFTQYGSDLKGQSPYLLVPNGPFTAAPAIGPTQFRFYYQVAF